MPIVEPLEPRVAPAVTIVSPTLATYTDVDGDLVTIKASKPILDAADFTTAAVGLGEQLELIDLSDDEPALTKGVNLTITARPQDLTPGDGDKSKSGDGSVNIGFLNATGRDLGVIKIPGDLGQITAGSGATGGVKGLSLGSMGKFRTDTGNPGFESVITGSLGSLAIRGDLDGVNFSTATGGKIGSIAIGGSLIGLGFGAGSIISAGDMGPVKIAGDIIGTGGNGGASPPGGFLHSEGKLASVTLGGSLDSSNGIIVGAGSISSVGPMGMVKIAGNVVGGAFSTAEIFSGSTIQGVIIGGSVLGREGGGQIHAAGKIGSVTIAGDLVGGRQRGGIIFTNPGSGADIGKVSIGGSILGGAGDFSGRIESDGGIGLVKVGRDIVGALGDHSGSIFAMKTIASVTVAGSLVGGPDLNPADANITGDRSGSIRGDTIGFLKIGGDILGNSGINAGIVSFVGRIGVITIGGSIIGGAGLVSGAISGRGIGAVTVGGDIVGGSGSNSGTVTGGRAQIDSITIGGSLIGSDDPNAAAQNGSFLANGFGSIKIGGPVLGGSRPDSGRIQSVFDIFGPPGPPAGIGSLTIGGSLVGGPPTGASPANFTGAVTATGAIGPVKIGGDIRGSDGFTSGTTSDTGIIHGKSIASVTVGGSIISGRNAFFPDNGTVLRSGAIIADDDMGAIAVKGSLVGNATNRVWIFARGQDEPTVTTDLAIKSVTVGGRVEQAWIFAGVNAAGTGINGNAQIGAVKVAGDWIASNLEAGATSSNGAFGDTNDAVIPGFDADAIVSKIAGITIGGQIIGRPNTNETFGFVAQQIVSFKLHGVSIPLIAGPGNDTFALGRAHAVGPSRSTGTPDGFAVHVFEI